MKNLLILLTVLLCATSLAQSHPNKQTSLMREGSSLVKFRPRPIDNRHRDIGGWYNRNDIGGYCQQKSNYGFTINHTCIENYSHSSFGAPIYQIETHTFYPRYMCVNDAIMIITSIAQVMDENILVTEYSENGLILVQATPGFIRTIEGVFKVVDCECDDNIRVWRRRCQEKNVIEIGNLLKVIINK